MELSFEAKIRLRRLAYVAGFFLTISTSIAAYVNSSFLEQFLSERSVGLVYSLASIISVIVSFNTSRLIQRVGNRQTILILAVADFVALGGVFLWTNSPMAILFLSAYTVLTFLLFINLDLYVEGLSDDRITGRIRGLFLTVVNFAWLASPFLAGQLVLNFDYRAIYLVAGLALIPFLYLVAHHFHEVLSPAREHFSLWQTAMRLYRGGNGALQNLRRIIYLDFLLNFFYAIMVIYMPIYLLNHMGFAWEKIGFIFTIMLVPFVILDFILGSLADRRYGEKEIMITGMIIAGSAAMAVSLIDSPLIWLWALVLFLSRVGAASWEIMKETYLFKKIDGADINILFVSRNTYPLAYIIAPLFASVFLSFFDFRWLFLALGLIILLSLGHALELKDTK